MPAKLGAVPPNAACPSAVAGLISEAAISAPAIPKQTTAPALAKFRDDCFVVAVAASVIGVSRPRLSVARVVDGFVIL